MTSGTPTASEEGRIIPLRPRSLPLTPLTPAAPATAVTTATATAQPQIQTPAEARLTRFAPLGDSQHMHMAQTEEAARHYLKFMLPAIPIVAFITTFVFCSLMIDIALPALERQALADVGVKAPPAALSLLPLLGALLVGMVTSGLCVGIYWGYRRFYERGAEGDLREFTARP